MAPAEFFKFAVILSAALSQHHLLGFEIVQLESITSTSFVSSGAKAQVTTKIKDPACGDPDLAQAK